MKKLKWRDFDYFSILKKFFHKSNLNEHLTIFVPPPLPLPELNPSPKLYVCPIPRQNAFQSSLLS